MPKAYQGDLSSKLKWAVQPDGGYLAGIEIVAERAIDLSLRVRASANDGVEVRTYRKLPLTGQQMPRSFTVPATKTRTLKYAWAHWTPFARSDSPSH